MYKRQIHQATQAEPDAETMEAMLEAAELQQQPPPTAVAPSTSAGSRKRPAAACGKLDIEVWARDNLDENEAAEEPVRQQFVSKCRKRSNRAAIKAGMSREAAAGMRSVIAAKAAVFHDLVHKRG